MNNKKLLVDSGQDWTFDFIEQIYEVIQDIAINEFKLDVYTNQLEVISSEQMLDAYCSIGMPIMYSHWSFGESFIKQLESYNKGHMGLAYEIVINSDPCIAYLMEENTALMQTLVIAHASFGHNHFFKNNYLFKQWTDAEGIIDYLSFAKKYIRECEEKYGVDEVETIVDAAHALMKYGVDKYKRPSSMSRAREEAIRKERLQHEQAQRNQIWDTIPQTKFKPQATENEDQFPREPQENILYFLEKYAPRLKDWQREIIRIVRKISQYFYPQGQTQLMNEGFATYSHYMILQRLHEKGHLTDGAMLEFYKSHTGVVFQPDFTDRFFSGINPYALGFAMMKDIERVATNPTQEDREWFKSQDWVGNGKPWDVIKFAVENFKDESFVRQYLSPKIIRDFKLFAIHDDSHDHELVVSGIHDNAGYKTVRDSLSKQYNIGYRNPDIQITDVNKWGDRTLTLDHYMVDNRPLDGDTTIAVLKQLSLLWGYPIVLNSRNSKNKITSSYEVNDDSIAMDEFIHE